MIGKEVNFKDLHYAQRTAINKLERVYGGPAVTITRDSDCGWSYNGCVVNVIFDTGDRRLDYVAAQIDSMGWRFTGDDWVAVTTRSDYAMKLDAMKFEAA